MTPFKCLLPVLLATSSHPPPPKLHSVSEVAVSTGSRVVCDVAVVGSGFAGLSAAIEASSQLPDNAKILIVEKNHVVGGNSVMNAGQIACVGSEAQQLANIEDSVELMMEDMLKAGVDLNHPHLLRKMIEESNNVVKWTEQELGIEYRERVTQMGGHSVPRTLSTLNASGNDIVRPMLSAVQGKTNVELLLDTSFQSFIMNDRGDRVQGIRVKNAKKGDETEILCKRGVVAASGGFSADVPFRSIQNPSFDEKVMSTNQPGATAEVLKEALRIGAMPVQLSRIQLGPWTSPDEHGFGKAPFFCLGAGFPYGIIVDPETSKRFVNELGNRFERSMSILKMGHPAVCIVDAEGAQHSLKPDLEELEPTVKPFQSLEELCEHYGMSPQVLAQTVKDYNDGVATGKDEEFGKPFRDDIKPIETAPFYGVRLWPKVHHTMGGLQIDENASVLNLDGNPIEGLYAAGEVAGGIHGGDRLGSCATLDCLAFGRVAGRKAACATPSIVVPPE
ncbi:Fumarate reductase flavoprotein subunit [Seminavis robusta]|uniref:Fumarate reductase flavoprotein subunit n=1 Tax=Seminavis robusta TaxID=568900 RepID=A0A9N8EMV5_9STRA|nr:Fumarate reductase flavoprotein subunit [Seminavis robusta]|eukprot:Sro1242_g255520.1 Fumarate reductase flavoprotein subunit (504) ;mRNA; f:26085-27674